MSPLEQEVSAFFSADGPLARQGARYRPREGQQAMAQAVAQAIEGREVLAVEAGTGVGKTYAYLVPALLSGRRTLVSTATKALQDQLFNRDLPAVLAATGLPLRTALLKGRGSYLCIHRLEQARQLVPPGQRHTLTWLARIETWATQTRSGDLAEVPGLDDRSSVVPLVTSTRENCLGSNCPQFRECHVNSARREALAADLVVVNHHLFFADVAVRESGVAELLPLVDLVIFDEAHQLNEIGVMFLGTQLSSGHLMDLARDALAHGLQAARGQKDWTALAAGVEHGLQELRLQLGPQRGAGGARRRWMRATPDGLEGGGWSEALAGLEHALAALHQALMEVAEASPDLARAGERAEELLQRLHAICEPDGQQDAARWVEQGAGFRLVLTPLDVAQSFRDKVLSRHGAGGASWVFTSATLGTDEALSWFTGPLGLGEHKALRVASPFDYPSQASLYVPPEMPAPSDPAHTEAVARGVWNWAQRLGGRTLVLTTTLRAVSGIAERLRQWRQDDASALDVLVQGEMSKRELLQTFERAAGVGGRGAVLVASASFWEGVDLPGEVLQLVVIDKLPFPPPDDPLVEARCRRIEGEGGSAFASYSLPEAGIALKQGAGRLIRSESDHGALVVCDVRLRRMGYGKKLLSALPPMRPLETEAELEAVLDGLALTRVSTTDRLSP